MQPEECTDTRADRLRGELCDIGDCALRVHGARGAHFHADTCNRGSTAMPRRHVPTPRGLILGWL